MAYQYHYNIIHLITLIISLYSKQYQSHFGLGHTDLVIDVHKLQQHLLRGVHAPCDPHQEKVVSNQEHKLVLTSDDWPQIVFGILHHRHQGLHDAHDCHQLVLSAVPEMQVKTMPRVLSTGLLICHNWNTRGNNKWPGHYQHSLFLFNSNNQVWCL